MTQTAVITQLLLTIPLQLLGTGTDLKLDNDTLESENFQAYDMSHQHTVYSFREILKFSYSFCIKMPYYSPRVMPFLCLRPQRKTASLVPF